MTIEEQLNSSGIAVDEIISDIISIMDKRYFDNEVLTTYTITPTDTFAAGEYQLLAINHMDIIMPRYGIRTRYEGDVSIVDKATTATDTAFSSTTEPSFIIFGNRMLVAPGTTAIQLQFRMVDRTNCLDQIRAEIINLIYNIYVEDIDGIFNVLHRISVMKKNIEASNINRVIPGIKSGTITPWPL